MMKHSISDFEIMAPVGSRESLAAAIQAGADSIYFGIENLNMRARSANTFTIDDLREIARTCDEHGMKSYLTVNTIIYDHDIPLMRTIVDAAKAAGCNKLALGHNNDDVIETFIMNLFFLICANTIMGLMMKCMRCGSQQLIIM